VEGADLVTCAFCGGNEYWTRTAYDKSVWSKCPRCGGSGVEPETPVIHSSLLLRNVASRRVWAVFAFYDGYVGPGGTTRGPTWGIHRMKPARGGGCYVWQIIHRTEQALLDPRRWQPAGFGDAWDHEKMEADPLP
jgi:hypothetical protein